MSDKNIDKFLNNLFIPSGNNKRDEQNFLKSFYIVLKMSAYLKSSLEKQQIGKNKSIFFIEKMIKKIVLDFYVYNLFKIDSDKKIGTKENKLVNTIKEFNSEHDLLDYFLDNQDLKYVLRDYYIFYNMDEEYIKVVIANTVNQGYSNEIFKLYSNFYNNYEGYYKYLINEKIQKGLLFVKQYKPNQSLETINKFLHCEFEDPIVKNHFISYILSNVYVYFKKNNIVGEQLIHLKESKKNININQLIDLIEKMNFRMSCFYDDDGFLEYIFKIYYDLYKDSKWYNFIDIRNNLNENSIDTIKLLDRDFIHPIEIMRDAKEFTTGVKIIEDDILNYLTMLIDNGYDDDTIIEHLRDVSLGRISISNNELISKVEFIVNLRLLIVSKYYEFINLKYDEVEINYQSIYDEIDDDINSLEALNLFDDEEVAMLLTEKYFEYFFESPKTDYEAMNKIMNENKFTKLLKINPNMFFEYRKLFGYMFPNESLETVDLTNDLLSVINNIYTTNLQAHVCDENSIYNEIAQVIKYSCGDYQLSIEEMTGFIICNIYERLKLKSKLNKVETYFIEQVEDDLFEIEDIIGDDSVLEQLIFMFRQLNQYYLDFDAMHKIRENTINKGKIKILEKYDPNYYIDKACLEKK